MTHCTPDDASTVALLLTCLARRAIRRAGLRRVFACQTATKRYHTWHAASCIQSVSKRDRSGPYSYRRGSLCMSPWQRKWIRQVRTGPPRTRSQSTSRLLSLQTARSPVSEGEHTPLIRLPNILLCLCVCVRAEEKNWHAITHQHACM